MSIAHIIKRHTNVLFTYLLYVRDAQFATCLRQNTAMFDAVHECICTVYRLSTAVNDQKRRALFGI